MRATRACAHSSRVSLGAIPRLAEKDYVARQASQLSNASRRSAERSHVCTDREIFVSGATVGLSGDVEGVSLNSCFGKGVVW